MGRSRAETTARDAVIDGWRGISVLMVIAGHFFNFRLEGMISFTALNAFGLPFGNKFLAIVSSLGTLGVCFFFMISGYLITTLLIAENRDRGRVSLKAFYARRIFRIMPAFYTYVITVYLLGRSGLILVDDEAIARSSVYLCNFSGFSCSWWLAHSWSLAAEEQFYLLWPMIFVFAPLLHRTIAVALLVGLFLGSLMSPPLGSFVHIMVGVIVALEVGARDRLTGVTPRYIWLALAFLMVVPAMPSTIAFVVKPAQPFIIAFILFGTVFGPSDDLTHRLLRASYLSKIGLISYSLYLWQQLSLAPRIWGGGPTGADILYGRYEFALTFAFVPLAIASYFLIERPLVAAGHRLSKTIKTRQTLDDGHRSQRGNQ